MLALAPLLLAAIPSTRYRLYGSDLHEFPRWTVYAIRLLASPTCDNSTVLDDWQNIAGSAVYCASPITSLCSLSASTYGPELPFQEDHNPYMFMVNPWLGASEDGGEHSRLSRR